MNKTNIEYLLEHLMIEKKYLSEKLPFKSRSTLYNRFYRPRDWTIEEMEVLASEIGIPIRDVCAIICGDKIIYNRVLKSFNEKIK